MLGCAYIICLYGRIEISCTFPSGLLLLSLLLFLASFSHQRLLVFFYWSLSDCKSPQVTRAFLCILADFNTAMVWMVSILLLTSSFSGLFFFFKCLASFKAHQLQLVWHYYHFNYLSFCLSVFKTFLLQAIQFSQTVLLQTVQLSISIDFVYTQLNVKTVLY